MASSRNTPPRNASSLLSTVQTCLSAQCSDLSPPLRYHLALSGGVDSVVLLHVLTQCLPHQQLAALHVHHGLSPNADAWAAFCAQLCAVWDIPLHIERVQVDRASPLGLEAAARQARYRVFETLPTDVLLLAHHQGDQAETLLLNLLRGAGVQGAAAMPVRRSLSRQAPHIALLRPLLTRSRADIESYARAQGLAWIQDESNLDLRYRRNFVRHRVLPALQSGFAGAETSLARASQHFAEAAQLLAEVADQDLAHLACGSGLSVAGLRQLSTARAKNALRAWLARHGLTMPDADHLQESLRQLLDAQADAQPMLRLAATWSLRRYQGTIHLVSEQLVPAQQAWQGEGVWPWGSGYLHCRRVRGQGLAEANIHMASLCWTARQGGELLATARGARRLKHYLQEQGIPPWQRSQWPCLKQAEQTMLWTPGLGYAHGLEAGPDDWGWCFTWQPLPPTDADNNDRPHIERGAGE